MVSKTGQFKQGTPIALRRTSWNIGKISFLPSEVVKKRTFHHVYMYCVMMKVILGVVCEFAQMSAVMECDESES